MQNRLRFCYITMAIVFLTGCAASAGTQQRSQSSIDFDEIKSAKSDCDLKIQQFDSLKRECVASKDSACVAKLERLALEMQQDLGSLSGKAVYSSDRDLESMAHTATMICGQHACRAALETADKYSSIGDKQNAKRVYRDVVTSFTGAAYTGFVKKAEFALEDLKSEQQKESQEQEMKSKKIKK